MNKKSYNISGFDCAHCAAKTEAHLNKDENISSCILDFAGDKLHIVYKDKEYSVDQLKEKIAEVETDEIYLSELGEKKKKSSIFDKSLIYLLIRAIIATIIIVLSMTLFHEDKYFYVNMGMYIFGILLLGYDIFWKVIHHIIHLENPLDEYLLLSIASIGAFLVAVITHENHFMDSLMVITLFQIGKMIEGIATRKSKEAVQMAVSLRVETAHILNSGAIIEVSPEDIKVNDLVIVSSGELVPVDGKIIKGEGYLDTSSLTGEFVPVHAKEGLDIYSGYLLKEGNITLKASKVYSDSAVSKIINLISSGEVKKSKADNFVSKFAKWYTPSIFIAAIITGLVGGIISSNYAYWAILGLKMLVVACPCAIVISLPLAYFSALGLASRNGIVVKGTNYLDKLNELDTLVTDKTGTLTKGEFKIVSVHAEKDEQELLDSLYAAEYLSNHPIGKAICANVDVHKYNKDTSDFVELPGYGVSIIYQNQKVFAGKKQLLDRAGIKNIATSSEVGTVIYVGKADQYLGYVVLSDVLKEDTPYMVKELKKNKIEMMLLSGDKIDNVKNFAHSIGIEKYHGELLPEEKVSYLEKQLDKHHVVAYLGDGINDAACIKEADIGIAMGAIGSDIAVESADIVIMTDHPSKVVDSIKIAKIARRVSVFNIIFALVVKIGIEIAAIISSSLGYPDVIPMWAAVLADTGLTVMLVINSLLVLYRKIDKKKSQ